MAIEDLTKSLYANALRKNLYHYTSLTGLLGIIKSQSFWASDIRYFNDTAEMQYTAELLWHEIYRRIDQNEGNPKLLKQFRDWAQHRIKNGHMLFIVSMTANGNLLSQWRGYCPPGKGVSIGFNPEIISRCACKQSFLIGKCIYDIDKQNGIIKQIVQEIEKLAESMGENTDKSKRHPTQSYYDVFEAVEADILQIAALLKHPSFIEEEEWRVVSPVLTNYRDTTIEYRESTSMLIPYIEFSLAPDEEAMMEVQHVYLGPTPYNNLSHSSLTRCLSRKGVSPKDGVTACQIPYRQE